VTRLHSRGVLQGAETQQKDQHCLGPPTHLHIPENRDRKEPQCPVGCRAEDGVQICAPNNDCIWKTTSLVVFSSGESEPDERYRDTLSYAGSCVSACLAFWVVRVEFEGQD
jgi:hypothetical protein